VWGGMGAGEKEDAASSRTFGEVGSIATDVQNHRTGVKTHGCHRVGSGVVQKVVSRSKGFAVAHVCAAARVPKATSIVLSTARA
jgi:hypothetical protein